MDVFRQNIDGLKALLEKKEITPEDAVKAFLNRIDSVDKDVKAFVTVNVEAAIEIAGELTHADRTGDLWGIPIAVKDNIVTRNIRTTCSSRVLENFIPPYESTATERLIGQNYIMIGKTNLDEFAMGSSTENSGFYATRNPWSLDRVPGGSSGGSAAAVAADECAAALGSDTGGSIRQPASFCGVVGMKPTYGRVSRYGLVAFASSLDQIGPVTKNVKDAAILLNAISGYDRCDSTSVNIDAPDHTSMLGNDIKGLKIGMPKEYFIEGIDGEVEASVKKAIGQLESLGAEIIEISLPHTGYAVATYYIIATSEASSNLARYDGVRYGLRVEGDDLIDMYMKTRSEGFGDEVKRRIMLGTFALSSGYYDAYYLKAQQVRTLIRQDFQKAFGEVDVIATPTVPTTAFKIGEMIDDPLQMYMSDILTISVNLAGLPAISVPCGFSSDDLPIGLQIIGKHFNEVEVLKTAYAFEQSTEWHKRRPSL
ncbi:MAG: Asp-tRNA(Asn)/Glu-tRNA(Gln) amidotransferase subunit GatA [Nitrospirota bacterium]|nr:MAG: Asp-tRNA(Asn)/Glu-tRNA(Gln) amidotransferase subunit GatA [Nitrospirota bacterium]